MDKENKKETDSEDNIMKESEEKMWFKILDRFSSIKLDVKFAFIILILIFSTFCVITIYLIITKANYYTTSICLVMSSIPISIAIFGTGLFISILQRYGLVKSEEETKYLLKEINKNIEKLIDELRKRESE